MAETYNGWFSDATSFPVTTEHAVAALKQFLRDRLVEHRQHVRAHGEDLSEVRDWRWGGDR